MNPPQDEPAPTQDATLLAVIGAVLAELRPGSPVSELHLDADLEGALALDSLARVELGARLEHEHGLQIDETVLFESATPRELLAGLRTLSHTHAAARKTVDPGAAASPVQAAPQRLSSLIDLLEWHVEHHPDHCHIRLYEDDADGETLSYALLWERATVVASHLQAHDIEPGQRVALMLPTSAEYFVSFYGVLLAGAVPVPIYPPVRRAQLEDHLRRQSAILANCEAVAMITISEAVPVARLLGAAVTSLRVVLDAAELGRTAPQALQLARRRAEDLAFLQYTSGSTGDPKGVMLSHANVLANIRVDGHGMQAMPGDTFVSWLPLYHDMGLIGAWLGSLYHGVHLVIMSPLAFLSRPARWMQAISRYQGNLSAAPNFAFELCLKRIQDRDLEGVRLDSWRIAANGAEAISAATMNAFCDRFAPYGFGRQAMFPVYGLAECSVGLTFPPPGRGPLVDRISRQQLSQRGVAAPVAASDASTADTLALVACGSPLPGHQVRIVDETGGEAPDRREGSIQFCGPSATSGYFARPDATAELIRDGWLETGDRGYIADGDLYITGRTKDIIIRAGRNIYPAEFEEAVGDLDGVRKGHVAVFGTSDASTGTERVVVLLETRKRREADLQKLSDAINALGDERLGLAPDEIRFVPPNTVLRTSSGKIRRGACRTLYEQGRLDGDAAPVWLQLTRLYLSGLLPRARRAARLLVTQVQAGWAWLAFLAMAILAYVCVWLPVPAHSRWRIVRGIANAAGTLAFGRLEVQGRHNLTAPGTGAIVVCNHQSYLDGPLAFAMLPVSAGFLIKADLGASWLIGTPLRRIGMLFIERHDQSGGLAGLEQAAEALQAGRSLALFPEGTFRRMPGLLPFRMGAFTLAAQTGAPIIPVVLRGTRSALRDGSWSPRRVAISMLIGEPILPEPGADAWQTALRLRDRARSFMLEHCGEPDLAHESNAPPAPKRN